MRRYVILQMDAAAPTGPANRKVGLTRGAPVPMHSPVRVETAELSTRDMRDLRRDPAVRAAAPAMPIQLIDPVAHSNAEATGEPWGIRHVRADASPCDGTGVVVAVLDTGVARDHEAFIGVEIIERDFTGSGVGDIHGHGTHCLGTILGRNVEGKRIGVARGITRALVGKVLDPRGGGDTGGLAKAIVWAVENGARVILTSPRLDFEGFLRQMVDDGYPPDVATPAAIEAYRLNIHLLQALMSMIRSRTGLDGGAIVVSAVGNDSRREQDIDIEVGASIPSAVEDVVSVGALERTPAGLRVAPFSNTLPQILAPGVDILSARLGGGLVPMSGTSIAAAHVAGVTALWWHHLAGTPTLATADNVRAMLRESARSDLLAEGTDATDCGFGVATCP